MFRPRVEFRVHGLGLVMLLESRLWLENNRDNQVVVCG
jgi:hypothetical protein